MDILLYTLCKRYTNEAVQSAMATLGGTIFEAKVVEELPSTGENGVLYLVPTKQTEEITYYTEFIWSASTSDYINVGSTELNLKDYATLNAVEEAKAELQAAIESKVDVETLNSKLQSLEVAVANVKDLIASGDNALREEFSNSIIALKAEVKEAFDNLLSEAEIKSIVNNGLTSLETTLKAYADQKVSEIVIPETDLTDYYKKAEVDSQIADVISRIPVKEVEEVKTTVQTILPKVEVVEEVKTKVETEVLPTVSEVKTKVEEEIIPAVETVAELRTWIENKEYLQDIDIDHKADTTYVDEQVANLTSKIENIEIPSLDGYATEDFVIEKVTEAISGGEIDLSDYAKKEDIPSIEGLASEQFVKDEIAKIELPEVDLEGYALKSEIPSVEGLAKIEYVDQKIAEIPEVKLDDYALKSELFSGNYEDLSNKPVIPEAYDDSEIRGLINEKADKEHTHEEYLTEHQSLENYYTKLEVDAKIPSLEGYAKTEDIPTDYLKESDLEGYSKFSGSYNDLTDKPEIPSIEGLATEDFVKEEINKIEIPEPTDLSNYYNKEEIDTKFSEIEHPAVDLKDYAKLVDLQVGETFVTDITVGYLEAGTEIKSTMTLGEILKRILRHPSNFCTHEWIDATCTTPKTCKLCGATEGEPLGHAEETIQGYAADCTNTGLTDGVKCSRCGEILVPQQVIPALGHDWSDWVRTVEPTCEAAGEETRTCNRCNITETKVIPALGHNYVSEVTTDPTCEGTGIRTYTCVNNPEHTYTEEIPALGHNFVAEITKPATCTEEGIRTYTCTRCGESYTEVIPVIAHTTATRIENNVEPDCTNTGSYETVTYCTECGEEISRVTTAVPALGHNLGEWYTVTEPQVGVPGLKRKDCSRCDYYETEEIPALPQPEEPITFSYLAGTFGNPDLSQDVQDWPEPFIGDWSDEEQEEISMHYVNNMIETPIASEDDLVGRHGFAITTPFVKEPDLLANEYEVNSVDPYMTRPAIILPEGYTVTAWNTDADNNELSECTVYSYQLADGRTVYYGGYAQQTGLTVTHYLTIIKN